jgi:hypothetical protein
MNFFDSNLSHAKRDESKNGKKWSEEWGNYILDMPTVWRIQKVVRLLSLFVKSSNQTILVRQQAARSSNFKIPLPEA